MAGPKVAPAGHMVIVVHAGSIIAETVLDYQVEGSPPMSLDPGRVMGRVLTPGDDIDDGGVKAFEDPCTPSRT